MNTRPSSTSKRPRSPLSSPPHPLAFATFCSPLAPSPLYGRTEKCASSFTYTSHNPLAKPVKTVRLVQASLSTRPTFPLLPPSTSNINQPSDGATAIAAVTQSPTATATSSPSSATPSALDDPPEVKSHKRKTRHYKPHSKETRMKISNSMLGHRKSDEMRAKVSEKLKGRIPWNKGKKLSAETRARMSAAAIGRSAWNRGVPLSRKHRRAISDAGADDARSMTDETRARMRMARRRPGDALVAGNTTKSSRQQQGSYQLVDTEDINAYVRLRRELRVWSDNYSQHHSGRRPSLADIRRSAPVPVIRKFEKYVAMRERIRGLAGDVYGSVDPAAVPPVSTRDTADAPRNNNHSRTLHVTKHGNRRLVAPGDDHPAAPDAFFADGALLAGAVDDMFDAYDRPTVSPPPPPPSSTDAPSVLSLRRIEMDNTLIGAHVLSGGGLRHGEDAKGLTANDFRKIGRYRLMETMDINRFVELRKDLHSWSSRFRARHGRTPSLSDTRDCGQQWYAKFCDYLDMRDRMAGLVKEVYGTEVDDLETLQKLNAEGKQVLSALTGGSNSCASSDSISNNNSSDSERWDEKTGADDGSGDGDELKTD